MQIDTPNNDLDINDEDEQNLIPNPSLDLLADETNLQKVQTEPSTNANTTKQIRADNQNPSKTHYIVLSLAGILFLLALALFALPHVLLKKRIKDSKLKFHAITNITAEQKIAAIHLQDSQFLILAIDKTHLTPLACLSKDKINESEKMIRRKTFWQKMAEKPLTDKQLRELLEINTDDNTDAQTKDNETYDSLNELNLSDNADL